MLCNFVSTIDCYPHNLLSAVKIADWGQGWKREYAGESLRGVPGGLPSENINFVQTMDIGW